MAPAPRVDRRHTPRRPPARPRPSLPGSPGDGAGSRRAAQARRSCFPTGELAVPKHMQSLINIVAILALFLTMACSSEATVDDACENLCSCEAAADQAECLDEC